MKRYFTLMLLGWTVFLTESVSAALPGRGEVQIRSTRSLRQQVDSYAELMQKDVFLRKNAKEKFRVLQNTLNQIRVLRENSVPQNAMDESHMDLVVTVLEALPKEREFKKKDCAIYENDLLNQFDPTAEEEPTVVAVRPAWDFLKSICQ